MNQRIDFIDIAKAIGIIFVVIGHNPAIKDSHEIHRIIFSFHMPLFFFLSGLLFKTGTVYGIKDLVKKRTESLLRPYFFTSLCVVFIYTFFKPDYSFTKNALYALYASGPYLKWIQLWFLPHLFIVSVFMWYFIRLFKKQLENNAAVMVILISFLLIGFSILTIFWNVPLYYHDSEGTLSSPLFIMKGLPWSLDIIFLTAFFFFIGYIADQNAKYNIFDKTFLPLLALAIFCLIHRIYDCSLDLNLRSYDNIFLSTIAALTGIYVCMVLAKLISKSNGKLKHVLQYIGKYALIIFIFHPVIEGKTYFTLLKLFPNLEWMHVIISFSVGICVPLLMNYFIFEKIPFFRYWYHARDFDGTLFKRVSL